MMNSLVFLAALVLSVAAHPFSQCGSNDNLHITSVTLMPDEPVPNLNLVVQIVGKSSVAVTAGAAVNLEVKVFGVKIASVAFDFCKDLNITCPLAPGAFVGSINYKIPGAAPAGISASVEIDFSDGAGSALDCIETKIKLGSKSGNSFFGLPNPLERRELEFMFEAWRIHFAKEFASPAEYVKRMDVFASNHWEIIKHNALDMGWELAHNEFSYLTWEEFRSTHIGFGKVAEHFSTDSMTRAYTNVSGLKLPTTVDWTEKGAVTSVKNQGSCGSCWSFSTTGALEGAYFLKNNKLVSFSEQQMVDCDKVDHGCSGGLMDNAFQFIENNGGLCTESDYPYKGVAGTCQKSCTVVPGSQVQKYTDVNPTSASLQAAVAAAPIAIGIQANQLAFQFYHSGVLTGECGTDLDHGVLVVGYGTDNGKDYWKVKNSWGGSWGENGYIRIERNKQQKGGQCGILMSASFPTL